MSGRSISATPSRDLALEVLEDVRKGRFAEHALSDRLDRDSSVSPEDRALATELVYGVLRWQGRLDGIIDRCADDSSARVRPRIRQILRMALYQTFLLDRVPDHAAVDQAVVQAKGRFGSRSGSFVNAVLRRALRERQTVDPPPAEDPVSLAAYYSHPLWLVKRWIEELGADITRRVLILNNSRASVVVRVNRLRSTLQDLRELWKRSDLNAVTVPGLPDAVTIHNPGGPIQSLPGYDEGLFTVQDTAAQMIAPLLGVRPGHRVLDACAAPGGKTSHLAALAGNEARITAVDTDPLRLDETATNLRRLGVEGVQPAQGDASDPEFIGTLGTFDRILLDPPCTNLGVLRRNPEAGYRTGPKDPRRFADRQLKMMETTAAALKPGGILLYSVCTVTREETGGVIGRFLEGRREYSLDPVGDEETPVRGLATGQGFFSTFPPPENPVMDGFFAARLERRE